MEPDSINRPDVVAAVRTAFEHYETALRRNDLQVLDSAFWDDGQALRYGIAEHSLGIGAIRRARAAIAPVPPGRCLQNTSITTFGTDSACVCTEFITPDTRLLGRQTQTWIRFAEGWKIVAAHVSQVDPGELKRY